MTSYRQFSSRGLAKRSALRSNLRIIRRRWQMYVMFLVPFLWVLVFNYVPMYGVQIAFKDFIASNGISGSRWTGLENLNRFVTSYMFRRVMVNTLVISFYQLLVGFPIPIILAVLINECASRRFARTVQMISYAPHFITTVVIVAIIEKMFDYYNGVINTIIQALGGNSIYFLGEGSLFRHIYVLSNVWQNMGYNSIIYVAALSAIDPALEEAATIDGAPPDTAAITSPSGQDARSVVTQSSRNAGIVHSPFRPHTPSAKFFSICMPSGSLLSTPNCAANAVPASFCAAAAKPPSPSADT